MADVSVPKMFCDKRATPGSPEGFGYIFEREEHFKTCLVVYGRCQPPY